MTRADGDAGPADVFVGVAAVADYRVADVAPEKIKKSAESMTLELVRNPDILAEVAARSPPARSRSGSPPRPSGSRRTRAASSSESAST